MSHSEMYLYSSPTMRGAKGDQLIIKYNIKVTKRWRKNYILNFPDLQANSLTLLIFELV